MADARITISATDLASEVFARVTDALQAVGQTATDVAGVASSAGVSFASAIQDGFGHAVQQIAGDAEKAGESIKGMFEHPMASLQSFGSAMHEHFLSALGPELGPVLGVASVAIGAVGGAIMELGQHATETGAAIEKVAMIANVSAAGISDLKFAFDATGGSLDQLGTAMFMFEKRMGSSTDTVANGLAQVGLSLKDIDGMSSDQQLLAISDAFRKSGDDVNRASAAFEIFGKQGRDMLPQLMQDLSGLAAKSKELGNTWTDEDAKAAHEFEIAAKTMSAEVGSAWTQLGRDVAPVTNEIALGWDRMKLAVANVGLTIGDIVSGFGYFHAAWSTFKGDVDELPTVASNVKGLADGSGLAAKGIKDWSDQVKDYTGHAPSLDAALENEKESIRDLDGETQKHIDTQKKLDAARKDAIDGQVRSIEGFHDEGVSIAALTKVAGDGFVLGTDTSDRFAAAVKRLVDEGVAVPPMLRAMADAANESRSSLDTAAAIGERTGEVYRNMMVHLQSLIPVQADWAAQMPQLGGEIDMLASSQNRFHDGITIAGDSITTVTIPLFSELTKGLKSTSQGFTETTDSAKSFGDMLSGSLDQALTSMPNLLVKAFTGGGGLAGATSALGSKFGADLGKSILGKEGAGGVADTLTSHFGDAIGGALGAAIPAVGALIGPLIGELFSIGGPSAAELAGRKTEAAFEQGLGGISGIGKALTDTGLSADEANAHIQALFAAEKSGGAAVQTQIDAINSIIKQHAAEASTGVQSILDAAKTVGTNFPSAMTPLVAQLEALPGLTDAEKKSLDGLLTAGNPTFADLSSAAGRYGLTLDTLGGKAAQLSISHEADQIESDYDTLVTKSGADSDKVLAGMKTSLTKLVDHALDAGAVLPTALEPLVKQLFNTGQLTDSAGHKLNDLSGLKFDNTGDPLASGMSSLTTAIDGLITLLGGKVPAAFDAAASSSTTTSAQLTADMLTAAKALNGSPESIAAQATAAAAILEKDIKAASAAALTDPNQASVVAAAIQAATSLEEKLKTAAQNAGADLSGIAAHVPEIDLHYRYIGDNGLPNGGDGSASTAADGGFVGAHRVEHMATGGFPGGPQGTDTVPVWTTPGEAILNRDAVSRFGRDNVAALNRGGSGLSTRALEDKFDALADRLDQHMSRFSSTMQMLPMQLKAALR